MEKTDDTYPRVWHLIWRGLLDADMHVRYYRHLAQRYRGRDRVIRIFLALTTSGAIASLSVWDYAPWAWTILTSVSTVTAVILPFLKWPEVVEVSSNQYGKWNQIRNDYEDLWAKEGGLDDQAAHRHLAQIQNKEQELAPFETKVPYDKDLLEESQQEVMVSRGINR